MFLLVNKIWFSFAYLIKIQCTHKCEKLSSKKSQEFLNKKHSEVMIIITYLVLILSLWSIFNHHHFNFFSSKIESTKKICKYLSNRTFFFSRSALMRSTLRNNIGYRKYYKIKCAQSYWSQFMLNCWTELLSGVLKNNFFLGAIKK